jgi:hypothetical protein
MRATLERSLLPDLYVKLTLMYSCAPLQPIRLLQRFLEILITPKNTKKFLVIHNHIEYALYINSL